MKHYLLFYDVDAKYVTRRAEFRGAHLTKAWEANARGELLLGGAFADPVDGAVLLFRGASPEVAADFARTDPYVLNGLLVVVTLVHPAFTFTADVKLAGGDQAAEPAGAR